MSNRIDTQLLNKYVNAFILYEVAKHGVSPKDTLEGTAIRLKEGEGYKIDVYNRCRIVLDSGAPYVEKLLDFLPGENLVYYDQRKPLEDRLKKEGPERAEAALKLFYEGADDRAAFDEVKKAFGGYFDVIGFIFFIKDCSRYLPIRSSNFESRFQSIGWNVKLQRNATWEVYSEYIEGVREVQSFLRERLNKEFTLLDAHSFLWIMPFLGKYIDGEKQLVRHQKYGLGVVIGIESEHLVVRFGKEKKILDAQDVHNNLMILPFYGDIYEKETDSAETKRSIPDLSDESLDIPSNEAADNQLISELKDHFVVDEEGRFSYSGKSKAKAEKVEQKGHTVYPRDRQTAIHALMHANYLCEIELEHPTFIRRSSGKPYTEPHHLVPLAYSDRFEVSLDVEENIVSLCSNCHNEIHYGRDAGKLIKELYNKRKKLLKKAGIEVSLEELLCMYELTGNGIQLF